MSSDPRERAVDLLLGGATTTEAAAAVGVHRSTVWRWLQEPDVVELMGRSRAEYRAAVRTRLESAALQAVDVLCAVMADHVAPHASRVRAAETILDRVDGGRAAFAVEVPDASQAIASFLQRLTDG